MTTKSNAAQIKSLVESAIRMLDDGVWQPANGGEWTAMNGAQVILNVATRFSPRPHYRVIHPLFGVWTGALNGSSGRNIGKPCQLFTAEQVVRDRSFNPQQSIMGALRA